MIISKFVILFFISYGLIKIFKVDRKQIKRDIVTIFSPKEETILKRIELAKGKKERKGFVQLIYDTEEILKLLDKQAEFPLVCFSSFVLGVLSIFVCLITMNLFLVPPLFAIAIAAPFVYMRNRGVKLKKMIQEELETALSIITNSYIRNENIVIAVEENIAYIHQPVKRLFQNFIFNCDYVNSDIRQNIRVLKNSLNNSVFEEWCNALINCQGDSGLRFTLPTIVKKLSYIRIVSVRLESVLYGPVREYIFMVLILFFNVPVFYVLNREWYKILINTKSGHITIGVIVTIVAVCSANVLRLTRPIEYHR